MADYTSKLKPIAPPAEAPSYAAKLKPVAPTPEKKPFLSQTGPSFPASEGGMGSILPNVGKTIGNIPSSARDLTKTIVAPVNPLDTENPLNIGGNIVKSANNLREIFGTGTFKDGVKSVAGGVGSVINKGANLLRGAVDTTKKAIDDKGLGLAAADAVSAVAKKGIEDPLLIPSLVYTPTNLAGKSDVISKLSRPVTRGADTSVAGVARFTGDATKNAISALTKRSEEQIEQAVLNRYTKGVKPLLREKTTPKRMSDYKDDVVSAVKSIKENKSNLKFTDETGEEILGRTPETLSEFDQSIQQTKKVIFNKYDELAKAANEQGAIVDLTPISGELDAVIGNKALQLTNPRAVKYAEELKDRILRTGQLDATTAQDAIQNYNKSLEAFYRNPTYDTASQAAIDALVANKMRESLDTSISGLTGEQYGALKRQYGALKAIERDVVKASLRDARKNTKGLLDFTDVLSGGQVVNGLVSLNPAAIAQGLSAKAIAETYKYLNSPNRAIKRMFEAADDLPQKINSAPQTNQSLGKIRLNSQPKNSIAATPAMKANTGIDSTLPQTGTKSQALPQAPSGVTVSKGMGTIMGDTAVTAKAQKKYDTNPDGMVAEYKALDTTMGGKVSNSDLARPLFKDAGYNGTNPLAVQTPSKAISTKVWEDNLKNSELPDVIINAGGSGAGKSATLAKTPKDILDKTAAIWDGNSDTIEGLSKRVNQAVGANKTATVVYTYAPVKIAFERVIGRMLNNKKEIGRLVPISEIVANHIGSHNAVKELLNSEKFAELLKSDKLRVEIVDNGAKEAVGMPLAKFNSLEYNKDELLSLLRDEAKKEYDNGTITKQQYTALVK